MDIDHNMSKQLKKYILSLKTNYMMKYMNTIIERGTIKGTVFSGHATRTTFGNSLRVYMYISFALSFLTDI